MKPSTLSWGQTMAQLASPGLFAPVMVVAVGVLVGEGTLTSGVRGLSPADVGFRVALDLALIATFWLLGPWTVIRLRRHFVAASFAVLLTAIAAIGLLGVVIPRGLAMPPTMLGDDLGFPVTVVLWIGGSWGLSLLLTERQRVATAELETAQARAVAARRHLDPHFLFNTLNAIAEWCQEDPNVAEQAILQLSTMLRDVLEGIEQPFWSLERELAVAEALVDLYRLRDPERVTATITASAEARQAAVPSLTVLPLVENALKHGPWGGHSGNIDVTALIEDGRLKVVIINPGPFDAKRHRSAPPDHKPKATQVGGRGLGIVQDRLALAFDDRAQLELETLKSDDTERPRATMILPWISAEGRLDDGT